MFNFFKKKKPEIKENKNDFDIHKIKFGDSGKHPKDKNPLCFKAY